MLCPWYWNLGACIPPCPFPVTSGRLLTSRLQPLHERSPEKRHKWVTTHLLPFHRPSHLLERRGELANEVMLSVGVPVPYYALQERRISLKRNSECNHSSRRWCELYEEEWTQMLSLGQKPAVQDTAHARAAICLCFPCPCLAFLPCVQEAL